MRILFVHQNYPAQFVHLAPVLAEDPANEVVALTLNEAKAPGKVRVVRYKIEKGTTKGIHPWVADIETKVLRAEAAMRAAMALREQGFVPDLIIAHHGWGESMFLKEVWPRAKLALYCEFFYLTENGDVDFDPEFSKPDEFANARLRLKNVNNLVHMECADAAISPTHWQKASFPASFRDRITVIHDGINTQLIQPDPTATITLGNNLKLTRDDEIITFVNRNLEPYRGYHIFMRALPEILRRRPKARVMIVGGNGVSYGVAAPDGKSWKDIFIQEVRSQISAEDWRRVHFLGNIAYHHFVPLLQISTVHAYLTYPFVLSWSLLEAMSAGCAIVASDTAPLQEAIKHGETGRLVDFFDVKALADETCALLDNPDERKRLGANARAFAQANYDLQSICLPRQLAWVKSLITA